MYIYIYTPMMKISKYLHLPSYISIYLLSICIAMCTHTHTHIHIYIYTYIYFHHTHKIA